MSGFRGGLRAQRISVPAKVSAATANAGALPTAQMPPSNIQAQGNIVGSPTSAFTQPPPMVGAAPPVPVAAMAKKVSKRKGARS